MASAAHSHMKGFFKEKKKLGISKPKSSKKSKNPKQHSGAESPDLIVDLQEEVLRQFDTNMGYGPCLGMSRLERWNRANALGLHPPNEVGNLVKAGMVNSACLWDGRV